MQATNIARSFIVVLIAAGLAAAPGAGAAGTQTTGATGTASGPAASGDGAPRPEGGSGKTTGGTPVAKPPPKATPAPKPTAPAPRPRPVHHAPPHRAPTRHPRPHPTAPSRGSARAHRLATARALKAKRARARRAKARDKAARDSAAAERARNRELYLLRLHTVVPLPPGQEKLVPLTGPIGDQPTPRAPAPRPQRPGPDLDPNVVIRPGVQVSTFGAIALLLLAAAGIGGALRGRLRHGGREPTPARRLIREADGALEAATVQAVAAALREIADEPAAMAPAAGADALPSLPRVAVSTASPAAGQR